jgi:hypothetical protein
VLDWQTGTDSSNSVTAVWSNVTTDRKIQRQVISAFYNGSASINLDVEPLLQLVEDIVKEQLKKLCIWNFP